MVDAHDSCPCRHLLFHAPVHRERLLCRQQTSRLAIVLVASTLTSVTGPYFHVLWMLDVQITQALHRAEWTAVDSEFSSAGGPTSFTGIGQPSVVQSVCSLPLKLLTPTKKWLGSWAVLRGSKRAGEPDRRRVTSTCLCMPLQHLHVWLWGIGAGTSNSSGRKLSSTSGEVAVGPSRNSASACDSGGCSKARSQDSVHAAWTSLLWQSENHVEHSTTRGAAAAALFVVLGVAAQVWLLPTSFQCTIGCTICAHSCNAASSVSAVDDT